jgi:hypothetical protein
MIRKLLSTTVTVVAATGMALAFAGSAEAGTAPVHNGSAVRPAVACTGSSSSPIEVNGFAFTPSLVSPGGQSTADLITTNCTQVSVATEETWVAQWVGAAGGGFPSGCPVIDPLPPRTVDYGPGQELAENSTYMVPSGCEATGLKVTVRINSNAGVAITQATATLNIAQIAQ